jgi:hypothetical protein
LVDVDVGDDLYHVAQGIGTNACLKI